MHQKQMGTNRVRHPAEEEEKKKKRSAENRDVKRSGGLKRTGTGASILQQSPPREVNERERISASSDGVNRTLGNSRRVADQKRRWTPGTPQKKSLSSDLSPSALRPKRKFVHHVRRRSTQWRDWLPTTLSSIQHASAASTATPNSALAPLQLFKVNFTVNPTFSSCSKAKATTTRASDANSTKSSGPPRRQIM